MVSVTAAGGVLYRRSGNTPEVLLIFRNGVWDLPKGKQEDGETTEACARREVSEEVGITLPPVEGFLTESYHEYERDGQKYGKTTYWYKMPANVSSNFKPQHSEGITEVQWFAVDDAIEKSGYENLKSVLKVFLNHLS